MTRSAAGAFATYASTLGWSMQSSRSMSSHQKKEPRAVSRTVAGSGSPETPESCETASTVQTLKRFRYVV